MLHVNDYRSAGGAEIVMHRSVEALRGRGIQAECFTIDDVEGHRRTPLSYAHNRRAVAALARRVMSFDPDMVHLHNVYHELSPAVLSVPKRCGRPAVVTAHDWNMICPNPVASVFTADGLEAVDLDDPLSVTDLVAKRWDESFPRRIARVVQHVANYRLRDRRGDLDAVFCPNRDQARIFRGHLDAPVHHLVNPAAAMERITSTVGSKRFVFAGRVEPEKGLSVFLRSAPQRFIDDLVVVGDGSELEACRDIVRHRNASTLFTGRVSADEAARRIAACETIVIPSLCPELGPLVALDALAAGRRLLVARNGGLAELADHHDAAIGFDPRTPQDVVRACDHVLENTHVASASLAPASAGDDYVDQLIDQYNTVLANHP
ncbi:MAG: glycosyltransferase [Ilumatobacter sp.]